LTTHFTKHESSNNFWPSIWPRSIGKRTT